MQPSLLSKHIVNISNSGYCDIYIPPYNVDDTFRNIIIRNSGICCSRNAVSNTTAIKDWGLGHFL